MVLFILQATVQAADTLTAAGGIQTDLSEPAETRISLIEMVMKGGPIMLPLAVLFLVAIYFLVERLLVLRKAMHKTEYMSGLKELIRSGNIRNAADMCKNLNSPESIMIGQGVARIGQPLGEIRAAMEKSGSNELGKLEKNLNILSIIGRIAPMFGFIGTIIGVITIFYDISLAKTVEIEIISKGLYQKMITSASGLVVGVFAFVFYYWLNARIDKLAHRMEDAQIRFLDMLNEPTK
jgi:biopolymer transport protein ExbB